MDRLLRLAALSRFGKDGAGAAVVGVLTAMLILLSIFLAVAVGAMITVAFFAGPLAVLVLILGVILTAVMSAVVPFILVRRIRIARTPQNFLLAETALVSMTGFWVFFALLNHLPLSTFELMAFVVVCLSFILLALSEGRLLLKLLVFDKILTEEIPEPRRG